MAKSSFISNSKRLPLGFLLAFVAVIFLETVIFSNAWLLSDWATINLFCKKNFLKTAAEPDVVIFGDSNAKAIDVKALERLASPNSFTVYNYWIASWGVELQYYSILKQYLKYKRAPKLILLSVDPGFFYGLYHLDDPGVAMPVPFRRFVDPGIFLSSYALLKNSRAKAEVDPGESQSASILINTAHIYRYLVEEIRSASHFLGLFREYSYNLIPSFNFRFFIRQYGPRFLIFNDDNGNEKEGFMPYKSLAEAIRNSTSFIDDSTLLNGQAVNNRNEIVPMESLVEELKIGLNKSISNELEEFIRLANERGIPTVFFFMPYWSDRYYGVLLKSDKFEKVSSYLQMLSDRYRTFEVEDPHLTLYRREYFADKRHLNKRGAELFNQEFAGRFKKILEREHLI